MYDFFEVISDNCELVLQKCYLDAYSTSLTRLIVILTTISTHSLPESARIQNILQGIYLLTLSAIGSRLVLVDKSALVNFSFKF